MNLDGNCATASSTMFDKQQQINDKHQIVETANGQKVGNPNLHLLKNAIDETTAEDNTLSKEISELLNKLQISPQTLPIDIKESLKNVTAILRAEGLSDVDETALVISMERRQITAAKQRRINRELKSKYEELQHRHLVLERKLNYLMENVSLIKNSVEEKETDYKNEYSNYKLLTSKLVEYNETASAMEANIKTLNLEEFEPDKLLDKYKKLIERKGRLAEINQTLKPFGDLPPNLLQAKAMLEKKELEYKRINEKFWGIN